MTGWCVNAVQTGWDLTDSQQIFVPFTALVKLLGSDREPALSAVLASVQIFGPQQVTPAEVKVAARRVWQSYAREVLNRPELRADIDVPLERADLKRFTAEIRKQLFIIQVILGMIGLVASLLIFVILYMIVTQKKRDMGIVRSVGSTRGQLAGLFLYFGTAIGVGGGVLGTVLGAYITRNINHLENLLTQVFGFKIWKSGVYLFSAIPNAVAWSAVGWIVLVGIGFAALGALVLLVPTALHPWYATPLLALLCVHPYAAGVWLLTVLPLTYVKYAAPDGRMPDWVRPLEFLPAYALVAVAMVRGARRRHWGRGRRAAPC